MLSVASTFWESLCACVYSIMSVFACVREGESLGDFTFESWAVLLIAVKSE